jgi:hypothetical protein
MRIKEENEERQIERRKKLRQQEGILEGRRNTEETFDFGKRK